MISASFSRVYDHSLPHSQLATSDVEGEWRTPSSATFPKDTSVISSVVWHVWTKPSCHTSVSSCPRGKLNLGNDLFPTFNDLRHKNVVDRILIFLLFPSLATT
ncbi:unnamed protein product [Spirodela intermedia]|uniref:Uncharacterized protein n=1 Tax=Spirodela intermedia TaxID=51605 RepID=A0A7I8LCU6_SPIIN|nr:unnamed protein product [Spirodela intermedia]